MLTHTDLGPVHVSLQVHHSSHMLLNVHSGAEKVCVTSTDQRFYAIKRDAPCPLPVIPLRLSPLITAISPCRSLLCVGCEFDQGDDPDGREFKVIEYVGDLSVCQAHCTADAACRAIEFDYNNRTFDADGNPVEQSMICILQYYKTAEIKIR